MDVHAHRFLDQLWLSKSTVPSPQLCAGCSHWSLDTVNPQVAIGPCFAVRNERLSLDEAGQTPYAAVKLGRNDAAAGVDLLGVTRKR